MSALHHLVALAARGQTSRYGAQVAVLAAGLVDLHRLGCIRLDALGAAPGPAGPMEAAAATTSRFLDILLAELPAAARGDGVAQLLHRAFQAIPDALETALEDAAAAAPVEIGPHESDLAALLAAGLVMGVPRAGEASEEVRIAADGVRIALARAS